MESMVGVAFPTQGSWLLNPTDPQVSTTVTRQSGLDPFGNPASMTVAITFVGRFLDEVYPKEQDFEIFRLFVDRYNMERVNDIHGEQVIRWYDWNDQDKRHQVNVISFEHLWGGHYAQRGMLAESLRFNRAHEVVHRAPRSLVLSNLDIGYLPHPGLFPIHTSFFEGEVCRHEKELRDSAKQHEHERVM